MMNFLQSQIVTAFQIILHYLRRFLTAVKHGFIVISLHYCYQLMSKTSIIIRRMFIFAFFDLFDCFFVESHSRYFSSSVREPGNKLNLQQTYPNLAWSFTGRIIPEKTF